MNFPEFWQNFDRILMWKVRMVRSVADRTFQPRSEGQPVRHRSSPRKRSAPKLKGSIGEGSNHSNFSHQNSVKILSEFRKIHQKFSENFWNLRNSQHFLKYSAKFREIFVRIGAKFDEKVLKTSDFTEIQAKFWKKFDEFLLKFWDLSGAKDCKSCRSRKTLQNDYLVAIVAVDTAENEPSKVWSFCCKIGERFDIELFN